MKLIEAIEKYKSKPKSDYPAENWVRLGQYIEPFIEHIEWLEDSRRAVTADDLYYYQETIDRLRATNKSLREKNSEAAEIITSLCKEGNNNTKLTKQDVLDKIINICADLINHQQYKY